MPPGLTTPDAGDVAELLAKLVEEGVNGSIVPVEDAAALAGKMKELLSSDLEKMGTASLEKIRAYTIENMAKAHVAIFEKDGG